MLDKLTIHNLKPLHGAFNTGLFLLLLLQALSGLKIRIHRKAGAPPVPEAVRKHRRLGPVIAAGGLGGFAAGAILTYLDHGHILRYPLHFSIGLTLVCLLFATALVARRMTRRTVSLRNLHLALGIAIIVLWAAQMLLGLSMLLNR